MVLFVARSVVTHSLWSGLAESVCGVRGIVPHLSVLYVTSRSVGLVAVHSKRIWVNLNE